MLNTAQIQDSIKSIDKKKLILVGGKGGVGKTQVSRSLALALAETGKKVLWAEIENPMRPHNAVDEIAPGLFQINCDAPTCFEEYVELKIKVSKLAHLFSSNRLIHFLAKLMPGLYELVIMGKLEYETTHYDHVVVDLPSTGFGLALFHATKNFTEIFSSGPVRRDAETMFAAFSDPLLTHHIVLSLPEEMPLIESIEYARELQHLLKTPSLSFVINRKLQTKVDQQYDAHFSPKTYSEFIKSRSLIEQDNLKLWESASIPTSLTIPAFDLGEHSRPLVDFLKNELKGKSSS